MYNGDRDPALVPSALRRALTAIESSEKLDPLADRLTAIAERVSADTRGPVLRGNWLGHAVHPLLTDFPLGCWLSAGLLDLSLARTLRPAARRLVGLGVVFAIPTALTGLADYATVDDDRARRVGALHAIGNTGVLAMYALSWRARRKGHHARGVALAMAGGSCAWVTGYLGGHLSFARQVGTGERGMDIEGDREVGRFHTGTDDVESALLANGAVPAATADGGPGLAGPNSL
jgi:uncharacterized membrane protein